MKRIAVPIVTGLLICCLNAPLFAFAANEPAPVNDERAISTECPEKGRAEKKEKIDVDALVKAKVINKKTGERVKAYLKEHFKERKAEHEAIKKMNEEDRRAYFERKYPNGKPDIWMDMADAGVITQDEAIAIKAVLLEKPGCAEKR